MSRSGSRAQTLKRKIKRKIRKYTRSHPGVVVALLIVSVGIGVGAFWGIRNKDSKESKPIFRDHGTISTAPVYNNESDNYDDGQGDYVEPTKRDYISCFIDGTTKVEELPASKINSLASNLDIDPVSKFALVNKMYPMSSGYEPEDLVEVDVKFTFFYKDEKRMLREEAAHALEYMFKAAAEDGIELLGVSGYRSFSRQESIYNNNLLTKGYEHTNSYSARPGRSEHQTGWAIDISCESAQGKLIEEFIETKEGQWVSKNCYKFGFIVRYPKGKEAITGYSYEPWHVRYVGYDLAKYLYDNDLTLDEYYGYKADLDAIEAEEWQYYIDYINSLATPTPTPTQEPTPTPSVDVTPEPTLTVPPTSTPSVKPTVEPTVKPTVTPKPEDETTPPPATQTPQPTETPMVTPTPSPTPTPAPTLPVVQVPEEQ